MICIVNYSLINRGESNELLSHDKKKIVKGWTKTYQANTQQRKIEYGHLNITQSEVQSIKCHQR